MRERLAPWRLLLGFARQIGLVVCMLYTLVSATAFLAPMLLALGLRPLVDGVTDHDSARIVAGTVLSGIALLLTALAPIGYRWATIRMRERSRMVVQRGLLTLSSSAPRIEHFERPEYWDRLQLLRRGVEDLANGLTLVMIGPVVVAQLVVAAVTLGGLQPLFFLIPLVALPVAWLTQRAEAVNQKAERRVVEQRRIAHRLFDLSTNTKSGMELRLLGLKQDMIDRHRRAGASVHKDIERSALRAVALNASGWLLFGVVYVGALLELVDLAAHGRASAGDVATAVAMAAAVVGAAGRMTDLVGSVVRVTTVAGHYLWLEEQAQPTRSEALVFDGEQTGIVLDDVSFSYAGDAKNVISGVSLKLPAGAVVAVVGENGAGKSTLVKLLCGMNSPTSGRILVNGTDLADLDLTAYRSRITAGFQDFARFEFTVGRDVGMGDLARSDDSAAIDTALARVGADFVGGLPQGAATQLGPGWEGGVELSGGQWQKVALARTLFRHDPRVLILDEPTASLDPQSEHALFEAVAEDAVPNAGAGRITVLISHRFSTTRMADLIVVMRDGGIVQTGTHDQLMADGGLYSELYQLQADSYR